MREVGILEAKTNLSALADAVSRDGEDVVITRHGKPLVRLTTLEPRVGRPKRRFSGPELLSMSTALQERISREHPESDNLTWEELKEDMRR